MSVSIGIIGLAKSGRTTVFNALTKGKAEIGRYTPEGAPHIGVTRVPDPRLKQLNDMLHPQSTVPAEITYVDIGASVKDLAKGKAGSSQRLTQLSNVDALINVVRAFSDESIPHPEGSLDVKRDIASMNLELAFSDLAIMERRLERIETALKGARPPERQHLLQEQEMLAKLKASLDQDQPIRELELTTEEVKMLANYQFLTAKPLLTVVNIDENQLSEADSRETELGAEYNRPNCRLITFCGKLEMELTELENSEAVELRAGFGITESGVERVIRLSYELLGLISFFSIASNEVRAWSIRRGTDALKAAGKIHTDMERGFIRAEVISFVDLVKWGNLAEARKKGLVRLESKNYTVQDGDVITFLFNI